MEGLPEQPFDNAPKMPKIKFKHILVAFLIVAGVASGYFLGKGATGFAVADSSDVITKCAVQSGINLDSFKTCINSGVMDYVVQQNSYFAMIYGISYTPAVIFNCKYRLVDLPTKESIMEIVTAIRNNDMENYIEMINNRYNIPQIKDTIQWEMTEKFQAN
ncbi:MAG: hypothetical protein PHI86_06175, partial [Candidatus Omnitrophica bacterium]|nr:hypothetical protein [Candidatus Omnitrophota bacterium]